MVNLMKVFTG